MKVIGHAIAPRLGIFCLLAFGCGWPGRVAGQPVNPATNKALPSTNGTSRTPSPSQRRAQLGPAAESGDPAAQLDLAWTYLGTHLEVPKADAEEGMKWLRRAADAGLEGAEHRLAYVLMEGRLVPADLGEAIEWLRKAAEQGCLRAQFDLAQQYACGNGDPRSPDERPAALLFKAAKGGWADAQFALGEHYRLGLGVMKDRAKAFYWFDLAAKQSDAKAAKRRQELKSALSQEENQKVLVLQKEPNAVQE